MRAGAGEAAARALAADPAALPLGHAAPDPELLAVPQRVLEALGLHLAAAADGLGLLGGGAALGEEQVGIDSEAVGALLPAPVGWVDVELDEHLPHRLPPAPCAWHTGPNRLSGSRSARSGEYRRWNYSGVIMARRSAAAQGVGDNPTEIIG